jgi:hypothetical protein
MMSSNYPHYNLNVIDPYVSTMEIKKHFKDGDIITLSDCEKSGLYAEIVGLNIATIIEFMEDILALAQSYCTEVYKRGIDLTTTDEFSITYRDFVIYVKFCESNTEQ